MPILYSPARWELATRELSMAQESAYHRLVDWAAINGELLPLEFDELCTICHAALAHERKAVEYVIAEFFSPTSHGYVQKTRHQCPGNVHEDPEAQQVRESNSTRKRLSRATGDALRAELAAKGIKVRHDLNNAKLRALVAETRQPPPNRDTDESRNWDVALQPVTETVTANWPVTETVTAQPVTETVTKNGEPPARTRRRGVSEEIQNTNTSSLPSVASRARAYAPAEIFPTRSGLAGKALKAGGLAGVNLTHPKLLALLDAGVTDLELQLAATEAVAKGKGFAYALAMVEGRRRDAVAAGPVPGPVVDARDARIASMIQELAPSLADQLIARKP